MSARRNPTGLCGILLVDKPAGMTSHDVVNVVRRITGERRVGHAGTLDPLATGLLVVLVGPATRVAPWLSAAEKSYEARIVFGSETDTDDAEGAVTRTSAVPAQCETETHARAVLAQLVGAHEQVPPAYSAIKVAGKTAHRVAREGGEIELVSRAITVSDATLIAVTAGPPVTWHAAFTVSKGTYVRALARDLGRALGTVAHLGALRRTACGHLRVEDAHALDDLEGRLKGPLEGPREPADIAALFAPAAAALGLPVLEVRASDAALVSHGSKVSRSLVSGVTTASALEGGSADVAITHDGRLLAVYTLTDTALAPATVIPGGVA